MNNTISITPRRLMVFGLFGILAVMTYGFAAANTVPASNAGDGSNTITGYTVSAVHYGLNAGTPSDISTLTFTVAPGIPAGGAVRVSVATPTSFWAAGACTYVAGVATSAVTCTPPAGTSVLSLANLRVVAAQ